MSIVQYTNEEFNVFYYGLKNNFKTISKTKLYESEEFEFYSESVKLNIDSYYESIFGQRFNSSLLDYYKQVHFEVKDENERNFKIISLVIDNFYNTLSYYYTEITESRYFYFLKPLSIEKKLGFQKGGEHFKNFLVKLILHEMRFEDGNFILFDETSGTIINALIAECVQNIRCEMIQNTIDLDYNDLVNDINKLELEKNRGSFDFLNTSVNLLRILKADMRDQYEELKRFNQPQLYINSENKQFIDINNTINNCTTNNNNDTNPQNKKRNPPLNEFQKKAINRKLKITFSPFKFRNLLIKFFENAGIEIDPEKEDRIDRFILNTVEFDKKKHKRFTGSPSTVTINFFNQEQATPIKFCALIFFLIKKKQIDKTSDLALQKILIQELQPILKNDSGVSTGLRNQIKIQLKGKTEVDLATIAGFKTPNDINWIVKP